MLANWRDVQSVLYVAVTIVLVAWQWVHGWVWWQYAVLLFLTLGVGVINHNHAHVPMWRSAVFNRATSLLLSVLQGHPAFVFHTAHNNNHHRYHHGERDVARTYRFPGGDSNNLFGYCMHPVYAAWALYPLFLRAVSRAWQRGKRQSSLHKWKAVWMVLEYVCCYGVWAVALYADATKAMLFIILPQLFGLHWLLATNYLQHAHADGDSRYGFARNFDSPVLNVLLLNIGLHTAHHLHPRVHWSELPTLHRAVQHRIPAVLMERSLSIYMLRVFVGGLVYKPWRTRSLRVAVD